jgi:hypothetical protein
MAMQLGKRMGVFLGGAAVAAICLGLLSAMQAEDDDGLGYTDTPKLPNSPWRVHDRNRPQPKMVVPGDKPGAPPSDAIVLFDGRDFSEWEPAEEKNFGSAYGRHVLDPKIIQDGSFDIMQTGWMQTKRHFGDCQLHIEWRALEKPDGNNLDWGNSGIFFLGHYELQILESHDNRIYADGMAGAVYGQSPPLVNPSLPPGRWQTYDVVFTAPRFDGAQPKLLRPAYITVFFNGVLAQNHTEILGDTRHQTLPDYRSHDSTGPIVLQPHRSAVRFRNIWVRPLKLD